jgi:hypothetical protein
MDEYLFSWLISLSFIRILAFLPLISTPLIHNSRYEDHDKGYGRQELRKCLVTTDIKWRGLSSVIRIESTRKIGEKMTQETRYYVSSCTDTAKTASEKKCSSNYGHYQTHSSEFAPNYEKNMPRQSIKRLRKLAWRDQKTLSQIVSQKFS